MKRDCSWLLIAVCAVAGCAQPPRVAAPRDVYDNIVGEIAKATATAPVAPIDNEAVRRALLPPLTADMPSQITKEIESRFDLAVNNAPASEVFSALVTGTKYSILVPPTVKETITVNLKDTTVMEALDAIRELYGYDYRIQGRRISVQPLTLQTRLFQVNYLIGRRQGTADVRVQSGSIQRAGVPGGPGTPSGFAAVPSAAATQGGGAAGASSTLSAALGLASRVTMSSDNDFWGDIAESVKAIVGKEGGRSVVINQQAGVIVVRAMPAEIRSVEQLLKTLTAVVERQVMIEAKIIEVTLNQEFQTGIDWGLFSSGRFAGGVVRPGTTLRRDGSVVAPVAFNGAAFTANAANQAASTPDPLNPGVAASVGSLAPLLGSATGVPGALFGLAVQTRNFALLLDFLQTQGTLNVLSSPRIATLNNQKAVLKVGTDEYHITNVSTSQTTSTTTTITAPTITTQPFFSGIALDVTPQIDDNDQIILHVHPSISQVTDRQLTVNLGQQGTLTMPLASSDINESDTIVRVQDENIVVIGGLMKQQQRDQRSAVPGASDLPVLGRAFRQQGQSLTKSELVILIKPTVIKNAGTWQRQAQEAGDRLDSFRTWQPLATGSPSGAR